jgi:hypothetical protein
MATLTPTLTLASTDISATDALNLSVTDSLAIAGGAINFQVATSSTGTVFAAAANYSKSYVFLKNLATDASHIYTIEKADGGDEYLTLGAGEWAFFPWAAAVDLAVDAAAGTSALEVRIYQAAS